MSLPPTVKLYEQDACRTAFTATVLSCEPAPGGWHITLDRTAFYPEGGGQPFDTGTLAGLTVTDVHDRGGVIVHTAAGQTPPQPGQTVEGRLDWPRRLDHMQQHTGEHILSGCLWRLFGASNVGFHIGDPAVRMDVDKPLTAAQLAQAEAEANALVRADTPVVCTVPDPATLAATDYRSKKELAGDVRLVQAGGDVCACCGTHVARTGQVGLIKILSAQNYKGGVRLAVACGQRAYNAVAAAWQDAEAAGRLLSAAPGRLEAPLQTLLHNQAEDHMRLAALQRQLCEALRKIYQLGQPAIHIVPGLDGKTVSSLAMELARACGAGCAILTPAPQGDTLRYALAAPPGGDVRELCRTLNAEFGGRGGGPANICQGTLPLPDKTAIHRVGTLIRRAWDAQKEE